MVAYWNAPDCGVGDYFSWRGAIDVTEPLAASEQSGPARAKIETGDRFLS
jgi:hypothetical protein